MDYFDCANLLYKMAAPTATLEQPGSTNPNYATGGAIVGGLAGVSGKLKSGMGPKKQLNPNYVKGTPKASKNFEQIGKKKTKVPFGARMNTLGGSIKNTGALKFGKGLLGRGLVGAGLGYAAGSFLNGMADDIERNKYAGITAFFEKVAADEDIENIRKGEIELILEEAGKRHDDSFLRDIDCEVCGYKGKPTNKGLCPECGATLGVDESKNYEPAIKPYIEWNGQPMNGISVGEQAVFDDMSVWASEAGDLLEKYGMPRAWKTNFSEGIRDKLVNSGILNYEKELSGLDIGSQKISDKIGVPISKKSKKDYTKQFLNNTYGSNMSSAIMSSQGINKSKLSKIIENMYQTSGGYVTNIPFQSDAKGIINKGKDLKFLSKSPVRDIYADKEDALKKLKGMDKLDRRYTDALFTRHEVDEARGAMSAMKKGRSITYGKDRMPTTQMSTGHMSPSVMFRESANVATAPPVTKSVLKNLRSGSGDNLLFDIYQKQYGRSGKLDVPTMNRAEKEISSANKPFYREMLDQE